MPAVVHRLPAGCGPSTDQEVRSRLSGRIWRSGPPRPDRPAGHDKVEHCPKKPPGQPVTEDAASAIVGALCWHPTLRRGLAMDATTLTALAGLITALFGVAFTAVRFRLDQKQRASDLQDQRQRWEAEFENARREWIGQHRTALRTEFLHELVRQRYRVYPAVLSTLGAVRDVPDPAGEHYESLRSDPKQLSQTAEQLLRHLYGEPGLVMTMDTRNQLLSAWYTCHLFQTGDASIDRLVREFFQSRRRLRDDLQIDDSGSPITMKDIEKGLAT
jgi:hypothetical protein